MHEDPRIEQFRNMARANPEDDLAHFALGQALFDARRHGEAAAAMGMGYAALCARIIELSLLRRHHQP